MTSGTIASLGLLLDITGAFFLAKSFVIKKVSEAIVETSDLMDGNPYKLRSAIYQRVEARVGFIFLFLGFVGQILNYTNIFKTGKSQLNVVSFVIYILIFVCIYQIVRLTSRNKSRKYISQQWWPMIEKLPEAIKNNPKLNTGSAYLLGGALDIKENKGEGVEGLAKRIKQLAEHAK